MGKPRIPKQSQWLLTLAAKGAKVVPNETGWPFLVSVKPDGKTQINLPATQAQQNPLGEAPEALF